MTIQTLIVALGVVLVCCAARFIAATKLRQALLLIASYFVYGNVGGSGFLLLLITSSLMNYGWGILLRRRPATALLWSAVGANVLLLAFFKYLPPLALVWPALAPDFVYRIILPLGISFWTFQALSYLFDTYLEEGPQPSVVEFCLYMAFWPTVTMGPVCRLSKMLPQFRTVPGSAREDFSIGIVRIIQGLFMKLVLAQLLAVGVTPGGGVATGFDAIGVERSGLDAWALAIGFGFQVFFDFAGYSHIAIGAARLLGIRLDENFNRPYLATTPAVYWTRWHMSLSSWIRRYVYLPLSTLRRSPWWHYAALVITMVIFGFWHDAKATLILWGLYNGLLLVGHRVGQRLCQRVPYRFPNPLGAVLSWGATFLLICLGFIFFRANDLGQALNLLQSVVTPSSYGLAQSTLPLDYYLLVVLMVLGYFLFVGLSQLLVLWTNYCRRKLDECSSALPGKPVVQWETLRWSILWTSEMVAVRKWWLLIPALALLLMITGMSFLESSNVIPFVYRQF